MRQMKVLSIAKSLIVVMALCMLSISSASGAERICFEDFESMTPGNIPRDNPCGDDEISEMQRPFSGHDYSPILGGNADGAFMASGGNPGQYAKAYIQGPYIGDPAVSYTEPKMMLHNLIGGGRELYFKFDFKLDADLGTSFETREIYDLKFFRITSHTSAGASSNGYWHPQLQLYPGSSSMYMYMWTEVEPAWSYYFHRSSIKRANSLMDNQWHTYEVYINVGTQVVADQYDESADGIVRIWEDGVLILDDDSVPFRMNASEGQEVNSLAIMRHAKTNGAPVQPMSGHLHYDNIEVWDGMPGGDTTAPDPPENVEAEPVVDP